MDNECDSFFLKFTLWMHCHFREMVLSTGGWVSTGVQPDLRHTRFVARTAIAPLAQKMNIGVHFLDTETQNAIASS